MQQCLWAKSEMQQRRVRFHKPLSSRGHPLSNGNLPAGICLYQWMLPAGSMTNYGVRVPAIQAEIANGLAVAEVLSGAWRRVPLQPQFPAPTLVRIRHLLT